MPGSGLAVVPSVLVLIIFIELIGHCATTANGANMQLQLQMTEKTSAGRTLMESPL